MRNEKTALVVLLSVFSLAGWGSEFKCKTADIGEWSKVSYVYDGDTVKLNDGRIVRLIGIDTPERARRGKPAEQFADKATTRLRDLISHSAQIGLQYESERFDKYGRTLAHLHLNDRTNIAERLLVEGLATSLVFPPNVKNIECLIAAENHAQKSQKGIWRLLQYRPKHVSAIAPGDLGFTRLLGRVTAIKAIKKGRLLLLDGPVKLYIAKTDAHYFTTKVLEALVGTKIEVQGQLYRYKKQQQIKIAHPLMITRMLD